MEKIHPASKFSYGATGGAKSGLENLHFMLSSYSYTIYQQSAAFDEDENGAGIVVKTPDGKSSHLGCEETSPPSNLGVLNNLGLRNLPLEALISSSEIFSDWPAESPNVDLLQGVRTHDFALVTRALESGADVNFHGPNDVGVLSELVDHRWQATRLKRVAEFDEETDRLLALLLSRGASPTISTQQGATAVLLLSRRRAPNHTVRTLLDAGWPNDYHYRLYIGAILGDLVLVKEALDHGADPNKPIHGSGAFVPAIGRASSLSYKGEELEQEKALAVLELLFKAGARIDEGTPREGGGDIVRVYANSGGQANIRPVLELLVRYATPAARRNSLYWLRIGNTGSYPPERQANLDWLIKRLGQ